LKKLRCSLLILYIIMLTTLLLTGTEGHGALLHPTPRNYPGTTGVRLFPPSDESHLWRKYSENYWYNQGCQIGCGECDQLCNPESAGAGDPAEMGGHEGPCCKNPMEPTIPDGLRTWNENELQEDILNGHTSHGADLTKYNPWRAPGYAPLIDSCGVGGGALWKPENITNYGSIGNDGVPPPGFPHGVYGTQLPASDNIQTWKAGEVVELMWSPLIANHGGGYQYRLCPTGKAAEGGVAAEECFQSHPLEFVGDTQFIQYLGNKDYGRYEIPATRVTEGVKPAGAAWTRNPFPPCEGISGGEATHLCKAPMFEPPAEMGEDWFGYGLSRCQMAAVTGSVDSSCDQDKWFAMQDFYNFGIIDKVKIPEDLPAGSYVMSWRWDVEQSPQIWANCADVHLTERPKFGGRDDDSLPNPHFVLEANLKAGCGFACKSSSDCGALCGVCNDGFCQAQARQSLKAGCGFACKKNADCNNNSFDSGCGICNDGFCQAQSNSFERLMKQQPLKAGCGFSCKSNADCNNNSFDSGCGVCNDGFCQAQAKELKAPMRSS